MGTRDRQPGDSNGSNDTGTCALCRSLLIRVISPCALAVALSVGCSDSSDGDASNGGNSGSTNSGGTGNTNSVGSSNGGEPTTGGTGTFGGNAGASGTGGINDGGTSGNGGSGGELAQGGFAGSNEGIGGEGGFSGSSDQGGSGGTFEGDAGVVDASSNDALDADDVSPDANSNHCIDQCPNSTTRCFDSVSMQDCRDENNDGCTEWSSPSVCFPFPTTSCFNGLCGGGL